MSHKKQDSESSSVDAASSSRCVDNTSSVSRQNSTTQTRDKEREKTLIDSCYKSWQAGLYTDVQIRVGSQTFSAHKLVLASLSEYFTPLFEHDSNDKGEITLHNIEAENFSVLLHYAYTGIINMTRDSVQNVLIAADYLSISTVKNECEKFMASNLDCDNVCDALQFAPCYALPMLQQRAMQFFKERLPEVSMTSGFCGLDPRFLVSFFSEDSLILRMKGIPLKSIEREKLILMTVLQYLSGRGETDPQVLSEVFQTVRLVVIPKDDIKKSLKSFRQLKKTAEIQKYLELREVAVKFLQQRGQDYSLTERLDCEGAADVPDAWFRKRKLANYEIKAGMRQYAAGGDIAVVRGYPSYLYSNPELEIERVEVWIRRWDGRPVIGGLAVTYRPNPTFDLEVSADGSESRRYCKGQCQSSENRDYFCASFKPGEYVVKVHVSSGYLIDRLLFVTNIGRTLGPFGGPGGGKNSEVAPKGTMSYLYDINCDVTHTQGSPAIYNLMFRWITLE